MEMIAEAIDEALMVGCEQAGSGLVATRYPSPLGPLTLVASGNGVVAILWPDDRPRRVSLGVQHLAEGMNDHLASAIRQLDGYFAGRLRRFDVALDLRGTPFQRQVWTALSTVPYGETYSYGTIADRIGRPAASRAVGAAIGRNPVSIVVPCHRVVGSAGSLTGFAGGLEAKRYLLALEGGVGRLL